MTYSVLPSHVRYTTFQKASKNLYGSPPLQVCITWSVIDYMKNADESKGEFFDVVECAS